jgi:hypothetical protein
MRETWTPKFNSVDKTGIQPAHLALATHRRILDGWSAIRKLRLLAFLSGCAVTREQLGCWGSRREVREVSQKRVNGYDAEPALRPTSLWNSGSSCRQSRSESLAAQFWLPHPAAKAFLSASSASAFFPRIP